MAAADIERLARFNRFLDLRRDTWRCVRAIPDAELDPYNPLKKAIHVSLKVEKSVLPDEKLLTVSINNGPKEKKTVDIERTNTGREMLQKVLKLTPKQVENLYLVCNGKTVPLDQKLCDLQLKPQITFIICQKCNGG
ncbi:uncharacterized protein isoform X1 [Danio rerio]|uniref:Si:ch211-217k17.10 n=8 Tax=Danio rerio TaxID=7955 RepID=B3DHA5_DANRE|nr:uncharacterized protein LOC798704 [Danio rerio]AAI62695.1 Si:ch211-217k17.10 [Danio rerio]AAI62714.1 Si:ch211-217k17.10 [Danio rerio]|eukprot:NP_001122276.1 si:ch211-217k17.10 [Danio rerio]